VALLLRFSIELVDTWKEHVVPVAAMVGFWGTSFLLVMTPGADWAYMITAGLRNRSVAPAAVGLLLGYLGLTVVVAAGVATVLAGSPVVLGALTTAGAAYLMWLGVTALLHPATPGEASAGAVADSWLQQTAKGAGISGLNPKALLLFLALLPQFTDATAQWSVAAQIVALGLIHTLSCAVVYSGVGVGARVVLRARPALARAVSRFSGAAMILIGVGLVVHQLVD
jgi:threonine/homoserine/homoserine lactone efflux protein